MLQASDYDQSGPDMKHGGDPPVVDDLNRDSWLDLSTGINPHSYPIPKLTNSDWEALPGRLSHDALLDAARRYYSVPESVGVIAVPGSEAAIHQIPGCLSGSVAIAEPSYSSHRSAWAADGRAVIAIDHLPSGATDGHLVMVNPNNPTGLLVHPDTLLSIAQALAPDQILIVDEAFMDCTPEMSIVPHMQPDHPIIVLKSFGKFFGLAGLRLGFVLGDRNMLKQLSGRFGDWCISGPALRIGCVALGDVRWQSEMRARLSSDMAKLEAVMPFRDRILGKTDLFLTYRDPQAPALHEFLADRKIWTRYFSYEPTWLRFGVPKTDADLARFAGAWSDFDQQNDRR